MERLRRTVPGFHQPGGRPRVGEFGQILIAGDRLYVFGAGWGCCVRRDVVVGVDGERHGALPCWPRVPPGRYESPGGTLRMYPCWYHGGSMSVRHFTESRKLSVAA